MRVYDLKACRKMNVTKERISHVLEPREIFLSFQTGFNLRIASSPVNRKGLLSGLWKTFIKRYIVETTNKAEL